MVVTVGAQTLEGFCPFTVTRRLVHPENLAMPF